jgi:acyl carrier protein
MSVETEICGKVRKVLVESLNVDEEEITPEATLQGDLGAESIDFLDIVFRLEREFGIRIPRGELFPESVFQGDPELVCDGRVTDRGMAELRSRMPYSDFDTFDHDRRLTSVPDLFTVDLVARYVAWKLRQPAEEARPDTWAEGGDRRKAGNGTGTASGGPTMTRASHLWAIGYNDMERAEQVRAEIGRLSASHCLILFDTAVAVRYPDGTITLNGEPFVAAPDFAGHPLAKFLAGLALGAPPLTGTAAGLLVRATGGPASKAGISEQFVTEVEALMKPGSSVLFVLDQEGERAALLQGIRGLGGTVLRTNVDIERARLIQSTLVAAAESL